MFSKVLIANRGEIAGRVIRTLKKMNIGSVAVYSDADRFTAPVLAADEAVHIGPDAAKDSYLQAEAIIEACKATGAEAVHPGYGFLSENAAFAERLKAEGIAFIGPRPEHLRDFGLKHTARDIAKAAGVPLLPGSGLLDDAEAAVAAAREVGYPVMLKSTAGGGGIGMQLCANEEELRTKFANVQRMGRASFGDARVYLERFVATARHVEVQIFGLGDGRVLTLGERDCSLQRRNQKVIEETPPPGLTAEQRARLCAAARKLGETVAYESAGTVEFIWDVARQDFYFLEVNTRLQVEHPVTEEVFGVDLVEWMIRQAAGAFSPPETLAPKGAAIEVRLYAENPQADFRPSTGRVTALTFPEGVRVDGWIERGSEVTAHYDPMLAKLIVHGADRTEAVAKLQAALKAARIYGFETNLDYLGAVAAGEAFVSGQVATSVLKDFAFSPRAIAVLQPGAQTSVQDVPGRLGLWDVGIPPSGPMDSRSHRLANALVGNPEGAAALECTLTGPTLRFHHDAVIALTGADMGAKVEGRVVPRFAPVAIKAGETLALKAVTGPGQRTYLAVKGGLDVPDFMGSKATFGLGGFGGHATGTLRAGDVLKLAEEPTMPSRPAQEAEIPAFTSEWTLTVRSGPHGAPDFFQTEDMSDLFSHRYEVHFNSARTGVRLIGPQPRWARTDGGEAGLHPSNIHDNAYAVGALDFTGDMPIILGPDGPSLGGFVCPVVVAQDDLWKVGQLKPGDGVRFQCADGYVAETPRVSAPAVVPAARGLTQSPILGAIADAEVPVVYRRAGDAYLLVEYGPMVLDIALRLRVGLLAQAIRDARLPGILDLTPGIRSLQVHFDPDRISGGTLVAALAELETGLPHAEDVTLPSRIVHLPLSWNDPSVQLAMRKYQELVRPDAPWCPSNIEFIRRINGLNAIDDVHRIVFEADYLVLGLGDVYLGAPVATPLDPRHRLVTTKYNPARTWTPENAVGIGGAYLCVYGMEGPGGYQLFGRTVQMWNSWRTTREFEPGHPHLLRFFDRIKFYPVDETELAEARAAFPHGRYPLKIEETHFSWREHARFLAGNKAEIDAFQAHRQAAFDAERADWKARGLDSFVAEDTLVLAAGEEEPLPSGATAVAAHMTGTVWKVVAEEGQVVKAGEPIAILESMKMEMEVLAPASGRLIEVRCKPGRTVRAGDVIAVMEEAA